MRRVEGQGFYSFVLEIGVDEGKIAAIRCVKHHETRGIGAELLTDEALSALIGQDVKTARIDIKSGATVTSRGINQALGKLKAED